MPSEATARDPNFAQRIQGYLAKPVVAELFGFRADAIEPGRVTLSVDLRRELGHLPGYFQGGVVSAIAELAASYAAASLLAPDWINVTISQSIHFVGQARGEKLVARGSVVKPGRTITSAAAEVLVLRDGELQLCAVMQQHCHHAPPKAA